MKGLTEANRKWLYTRFGRMANLFVETLGGFGYNILSKAADYVATTADNGKTIMLTAAANVTLPAPAKGLHFTICQIADANMIVTGSNNIIALHDAAASTLTFSTAGNKIGACVHLFAIEVSTGVYKYMLAKWCENTMVVA